jgi:hypothetical protein
MNVKKLLVLNVLVFQVWILQSQTENILQGFVFDTKETPLERADIIVSSWPSKGDSVQYFAVTDSKGFFKMDLDPLVSIIHVKVSLLGKKTKFLILRKSEFSNKTQHILLSDYSFRISEITIRANRLPYAIREDTTEYDVGSYIDPGDVNVRDVLEKLPGFIVSEEGDIFFKGKKIRQVLINNMNLFEENTRIPIHNIGAELIDTIQVIENYTENLVLKNFDEETESIINLKFKKNLSGFFLRLQPWVGTHSKIHLQANIYSLRNRSGNILLLNHNNTGNTVQKIGIKRLDYEENTNPGILQRSPVFSNEIMNPFDLNGLEDFNQLYLGNYHFNYRLKNNASLQGNIQGFSENRYFNHSLFNEYLIGTDPYPYQLTQDRIRNDKVGKFMVTYRSDPVPESNFQTTLTLRKNFATNSYTELLVSDSISRSVSGLYDEESFEMFVSSEYTKAIKTRGAFMIHTHFFNGHYPQKVNLVSDLSDSLMQDPQQNRTFQATKAGTRLFSLETSYMQKYNALKHFVRFYAGVNREVQNMNNILNDVNLPNPYNEGVSDTKLKTQKLFLGSKYRFSHKNIEMSVELKPVLLLADLAESGRVFRKEKILFVEPSFALSMRRPLHNLLIAYSLDHSLLPVEKYTHGILLKTPRHYQEGCDFFLTRNQNVLLHYVYTNLFHHIIFNGSVLGNHQKPGVGSIIQIEHEKRVSRLVQTEDLNSLFMNLQFEKFVKCLRSRFSSAFNFSLIESENQIYTDKPQLFTAFSNGYQFWWNTVFKGPLNVNLGVDYATNSLKIEEEVYPNSESSLLHGELEMKIDWLSGLYSGILLDAYHVDESRKLFFFVDLMNRYSFKNSTLELSVTNLFNEKRFFHTHLSDYSRSINEFSVQSIYFMLKFSFYIPVR